MRNAVRYEVRVQRGVEGPRFAAENQNSPRQTGAFAVNVIYTTERGTRRALEDAWGLAQGLDAHVRLVFIYAVPYSLPLTKPAVSLSFLEDKLVRLASGFSGKTSVHIFLCREAFSALEDVLPQSSLVIIGGTRHGWMTKVRRLQRQLKKLGHEVIFAYTR
jgi:hypothetical protein